MGEDSSVSDDKEKMNPQSCYFCTYSTFFFVNPYIIVSQWFGKISYLKSACKMCFLLLHFSLSLTGLNLNIQLRGLYFSMRNKGHFFFQTFTNVYLFNGPFSYTVLNTKRDILTLYFPIIKTNYLIGCFDTPYFLLKRPSISLHTSSVGK